MAETTFKFFFFLAILVACLVVIGLFLLFIKIFLLFFPSLSIMGINFSLSA
jgi:hypothetical protein